MICSPTLLFVFIFLYICGLYPRYAAIFFIFFLNSFFFRQEHVAVLQALKVFYRLIKKGLPGLYQKKTDGMTL